MFNIGSGELVLIAVVALLVLGPKRLPELARGLGKFLREFRRQTDEVRNVVEREFYKMDKEDVAPPLDAPVLPPSTALEPTAAPGNVPASAPLTYEQDHEGLVPPDPQPVTQHVDPTPAHPEASPTSAAPAVPAATPAPVTPPDAEPAKKAG